MKKLILSFALILTILEVFAQDTSVEMADQLRADGKIYVVVGVLCIIFTGLMIYLLLLDKKISKLEQQVRNQQESE